MHLIIVIIISLVDPFNHTHFNRRNHHHGIRTKTTPKEAAHNTKNLHKATTPRNGHKKNLTPSLPRMTGNPYPNTLTKCAHPKTKRIVSPYANNPRYAKSRNVLNTIEVWNRSRPLPRQSLAHVVKYSMMRYLRIRLPGWRVRVFGRVCRVRVMRVRMRGNRRIIGSSSSRRRIDRVGDKDLLRGKC